MGSVMSRKLLALLVCSMPILLVLLAVSGSGFMLISGQPSDAGARILRGWCGFLIILITSDALLLVTLLGWQRLVESSMDADPELEMSSSRYGDDMELTRDQSTRNAHSISMPRMSGQVKDRFPQSWGAKILPPLLR